MPPTLSGFPNPGIGGNKVPVPLTGSALEAELQILRGKAQNKRLDLTDAFSEYAGSGREANIGLMMKSRFRAAMGTIFNGVGISHECLNGICLKYCAGDPDPGEPGGYLKVRWKQFAIDFDDIPLGARHLPADIDEKLYKGMQELRAEAVNKRLDMTDAFEEACAGTGREANLGLMTKQGFRSVMGTLFHGIALSEWVLRGICKAYGAGDPDPRDGAFQKVRWKQFAIDFDEIPLPVKALPPDPTDEIRQAMTEMNEYCNKNAIDLANDFEEFMGGKDKCSSDLMPRTAFKRAMGVLLGRATSLYRHDEQILDAICKAYAAGKPEARNPNQYEQVQWREFAGDVNRIKPQPFLEGLQGEVILYPQRGALGLP